MTIRVVYPQSECTCRSTFNRACAGASAVHAVHVRALSAEFLAYTYAFYTQCQTRMLAVSVIVLFKSLGRSLELARPAERSAREHCAPVAFWTSSSYGSYICRRSFPRSFFTPSAAVLVRIVHAVSLGKGEVEKGKEDSMAELYSSLLASPLSQSRVRFARACELPLLPRTTTSVESWIAPRDALQNASLCGIIRYIAWTEAHRSGARCSVDGVRRRQDCAPGIPGASDCTEWRPRRAPRSDSPVRVLLSAAGVVVVAATPIFQGCDTAGCWLSSLHIPRRYVSVRVEVYSRRWCALHVRDRRGPLRL